MEKENGELKFKEAKQEIKCFYKTMKNKLDDLENKSVTELNQNIFLMS